MSTLLNYGSTLCAFLFFDISYECYVFKISSDVFLFQNIVVDRKAMQRPQQRIKERLQSLKHNSMKQRLW